MMMNLYKNIHLNNGMEKKKGCAPSKTSVLFLFIESIFSLYFFDEEFYANVKTLNDQENGGVGVVLGRKVRHSNLFFSLLIENT
jgi:hypothetical protein